MAKLYVDSGRSNDAAGTGSSKEPFKTITHALDVASASDTIIVCTGLYDRRNGEAFPIRMKPDVNMEGIPVIKGPHRRMVRGPDGNYYSLPIIYGGAITTIDPEGRTRFTAIIGADRASLSKCVVFTTDSPMTDHNGVGILCSSTSPTIVNNSFLGDGHAGVTILGRGHPHIENNTFYKSISSASSSSRVRIFSMDWGITAHGDGEPFILANEIKCSNGIDITQHSNANVQNNQIFCEICGLRIQNESSPTIINNMIVGHRSQGIMINDEPTPLIQSNYIVANGSGDFGNGGVVIFHQARPDLGGGDRESRGGNVIQDNTNWDLFNWSPNEIYALHNSWSHIDPHDIDRFDIYDNDESPRSGAVHF